jgi:hypothetical protein
MIDVGAVRLSTEPSDGPVYHRSMDDSGIILPGTRRYIPCLGQWLAHGSFTMMAPGVVPNCIACAVKP